MAETQDQKKSTLFHLVLGEIGRTYYNWKDIASCCDTIRILIIRQFPILLDFGTFATTYYMVQLYQVSIKPSGF